MYSCAFFKENDALTEFMNLCIEKYGLIPSILCGQEKGITFSSRVLSIGVAISSDPICIKITSIKYKNTECHKTMTGYYPLIKDIMMDLVECAKMYNITLGIWVEDVDVCVYKELGFKVVELDEKVWMEYTQLLN